MKILVLLILFACAPNPESELPKRIPTPVIQKPANAMSAEPVMREGDSFPVQALKFAKAWTHNDSEYYDRIDQAVPRTKETHERYLLEIEKQPEDGAWSGFWWNALRALKQLRGLGEKEKDETLSPIMFINPGIRPSGFRDFSGKRKVEGRTLQLKL